MTDSKKQARRTATVSHRLLSSQESPKEKVTIRVAAKTLNLSKGKIITYLNQGILTRLKEGDRIYILMDELRALRDSVKKLDVTTSIDKSSVRERTKAKLRELEKEQQKRPGDSRSTANANNQHLLEKTQASLLMVEELKSLRRPWWKELFGHLRLRPERSMEKGVVLFGTLALLAVLIFSVWWFNRSPKQPSSPEIEGQASGYETVQVTPQTVLDSELEQEQSARVVQLPSGSLHTTVAPEPEPAALNAQTPQPYSSSVEESPYSEKRARPLSEADQQVVGLSSTPPPYILRVETMAPTWLRVVIDERQELEYLLHPNEKHTWRARSGFRLHIGNAAGLQLYLNDQLLKPLGKSGEVVHLQLPDPSLIVTSSSEYTEPASKP
jgi:hypothetical protein